MRPYIIRQGDYLTKLAALLGFDADAVWSHQSNSQLRDRRPDRDMLLPGDVLQVPESAPSSLSLSPGGSHRFKARLPSVEVKLQLHDHRGAALADKSFTVAGLSRALTGRTDGDGRASFRVPVHTREVSLSLEDGHVFRVMVGDMDPIEEPSGVKKRLAHLGYHAPGDAAEDDAVRRALQAFQRDRGLEPTGLLNDGTRSALVEAHGS